MTISTIKKGGADTRSTKPSKIVAVDDEPSVTAFYRRVLEGAGHQVWTAHNGREGIEIISSIRPRLVILDVMMPVLQGYDVCRYVKDRFPGTKVLMLSALSRETDKRWALECGADAYLSKPVEMGEFRKAVETLLTA